MASMMSCKEAAVEDQKAKNVASEVAVGKQCLILEDSLFHPRDSGMPWFSHV